MDSLAPPSFDAANLQPPSIHAPAPQDEELPDYEPEAAPEYNRELHEQPLRTYYLRQLSRKSLMVVPYGPSTADTYRVLSRGARLFSKKPEMELWRTVRAPKGDEYVAGIWFDADGPIPWCPRARFVRQDTTHGAQTYRMESPNFSDWALSIQGTTYTWVLQVRPHSLVLRATGAQETMARFTFSTHGLRATGGAEAGDLVIYRDTLSADRAGMENILCSLVTVLNQCKKMGRLYWNEASDFTTRRASLPEERVPLHRTAVGQFWGYER